MATDISLEQRIHQLFQHLQIRQAHIAGRDLGDLNGFLSRFPEQVQSLTLVCAKVPSPELIHQLGSRLLVFDRDQEPRADKVRQALKASPDSTLVLLRNVGPWSDVVPEHLDEIEAPMNEFLARATGPDEEGFALRDGEQGESVSVTVVVVALEESPF
jgi:pimeloyl-ACP methyl ester carboxylesterase